MQIMNVKHKTELLNESLEMDFVENNDIIADLTITKYLVDIMNPNLNTKNYKSIRKFVLNKNQSHQQVISINTYSNIDSYLQSDLQVEHCHNEIFHKIKKEFSAMTGIFPDFIMVNEEKITGSISTYNTIVTSQKDILKIIMNNLEQKNIFIEEDYQESEEDEISYQKIHKL